ncbi:hypothetical protein EDD18DRAFT_1399141 [Armillaria luteobubalina]|uniref:Uncharacterized protein n=1 Tax=Armillaria luteobubalina TaxID=153913 RepID=A0AA39QMU2_9AGAR|nr:hypothetical protein EDD18DRAFT_1399141 [Armillaria luteobubalina]
MTSAGVYHDRVNISWVPVEGRVEMRTSHNDVVYRVAGPFQCRQDQLRNHPERLQAIYNPIGGAPSARIKPIRAFGWNKHGVTFGLEEIVEIEKPMLSIEEDNISLREIGGIMVQGSEKLRYGTGPPQSSKIKQPNRSGNTQDKGHQEALRRSENARIENGVRTWGVELKDNSVAVQLSVSAAMEDGMETVNCAMMFRGPSLVVLRRGRKS